MMYCHEEHKACLWEDVDDGEEQPGQQQLRYLAPQAGEDDNDGDYCNCDYEDYDDYDYGDAFGGEKKKPEKHRDRGDEDDDGEDDDDDEEAEET